MLGRGVQRSIFTCCSQVDHRSRAGNSQTRSMQELQPQRRQNRLPAAIVWISFGLIGGACAAGLCVASIGIVTAVLDWSYEDQKSPLMLPSADELTEPPPSGEEAFVQDLQFVPILSIIALMFGAPAGAMCGLVCAGLSSAGRQLGVVISERAATVMAIAVSWIGAAAFNMYFETLQMLHGAPFSSHLVWAGTQLLVFGLGSWVTTRCVFAVSGDGNQPTVI